VPALPALPTAHGRLATVVAELGEYGIVVALQAMGLTLSPQIQTSAVRPAEHPIQH
jgi:hypothetical protein